MIIELHSLITHDFFTVTTRTGKRDYDSRKISNASRARLWKMIDSGVDISTRATPTWFIHLESPNVLDRHSNPVMVRSTK